MLKRFCKLFMVMSFVLSFFFVFDSVHSVAFADAVVHYTVTDTYLGNGSAEVRGYFTNKVNRPVVVTKYQMGVTFVDRATGRVLYSKVKVFDMGRLYVDRGKVYYKFVFKDSYIKPNTNAQFTSYNRYVWHEWCNRK